MSAPNGSGRALGRAGDAGPVQLAWQAYQAAAQQLDAVRQAAVAEATRHAQAVRAAREELTSVRAQLSASHARLRGLGAAPQDLLPRDGDVAAAEQRLGGGPAGVLDALHRARSTLESSDAALIGKEARPPIRLSRVGRRNLLGYAPLALAAVAVQIVVYVVAGLVPRALIASLLLPVVAFGLGWLMVGLAFPRGPSGRAERTALLGAVVCAVPALVAFLAAVVVG